MRSFGIVATFLAIVSFAQTASAKDLLWQTNAEGDDIHIIDIETARLIHHMRVGPNPHGIATTPTSDTVFVSIERDGEENGELIWIDKKSFKVKHRLPVGPEPHAIAITPNGRWVYVPCRDGSYWIIDTKKREVVDKVKTGGRPHNTTASPNGRYVYLSPMGAPKSVTIVEPAQDHKVTGVIPFSSSVRPPALAMSRNLFFQHVDGLNGFEVADITKRKVIKRVKHKAGLGMPIVPKAGGYLSFSGLNRCHGLAVRPGDKEIWSVCGKHTTIHSILENTFPETAHLKLPGKGYWLTFSPDGRFAFIALSGKSKIAMIDTSTQKVVKMLNAGDHPKRNIVISD